MIIKDLFNKDIFRPIEGVVTIGNEDEQRKQQELAEYVCTEEIVKCFRTFFRKYRESITVPTEKMGVWITGFFGSGKSHFLKILGYLLENDEIAGMEAVRYFEDKINDQIVLADIKTSAKANNKVVLLNIDSKAKSDSKTKSQSVMDILLRSFNEAIGYCGSSPWVADMERTLDEEGDLTSFIACFEELSGKDWKKTRAKAFLNRDYIIKALVKTRGITEESARAFFDDQSKNFTNTTEEFAQIVNEYCKKTKKRVVFLVDEAGQFMGTNTQLMLNLQTCVEDLGKYCRGQVWVVVTSQQELKAMIDSTKEKQQDFSKIQGRFNTRLLLSGANADEVIKKRILDKKENAVNPLCSLYESNSSKLANLILFQAKPTWSGFKDANEFKDVYPFVSYQFELLQKVFEAIREHGMSEGKHLSQNERSLLDAFQSSAKDVADLNAGILVPFDSFYSTIEQFIDYDVKTVFISAEKRASLNQFDIRVLHVLFMIKHVKEMPATIDRLATLLVDNMNTDKAELKQSISESLKRLENETLIQKNGDEYDFLTNAEQDVNRQIINSAYNEGEVQRRILDIIYDKVLESNKYRYEGRYDFGLNRYVDSEIKGSYSQENLTVKFSTQYSNLKEDVDFATESLQINGIVVNLTEGAFIEELIRAEKIAAFKRNNSASMSASLTEIMSKKTAEASDRIKRAEDIIRTSLKSAPIFLSGQKLDIKHKDGKDRLLDAFKEMVKHDYYKLGLVEHFYQDQKSVVSVLSEQNQSLEYDFVDDVNAAAYSEITSKIKDDKQVLRKTTVKSLLEFFTKKPYGWRDLDVIGMLGVMWKHHAIQILIHDNVMSDKNTTFITDFARKNNIDTMVVRLQEKIDDQILYQVKRIMNNVYSENIELVEDKLFEGVSAFFSRKRDFISGLKSEYGNSYAGHAVAAKIFNDFDAILKCSDALTMFNEIISRSDDLEDRAEILEQLEAFYKSGSNQQKTFNEAREICKWYSNNCILEDLSKLTDVVEKMNAIISLEMPFTKMNELANLVFAASSLKDEIIIEKYEKTKSKIELDRDMISKELSQSMACNLSDEQKNKIKEKSEEVMKQYDTWIDLITKNTPNLDSYLTASMNTLSGFREYIASVMLAGGEKPVRSKRIRVSDCIPVVNKKITSMEDVNQVIDIIKSKLISELQDNDEINLD